MLRMGRHICPETPQPLFYLIHLQNHPLHHFSPRSITEGQGRGARELLPAGGSTRTAQGAGIAPTTPSTFLLLPRLAIPVGTTCHPTQTLLSAARPVRWGEDACRRAATGKGARELQNPQKYVQEIAQVNAETLKIYILLSPKLFCSFNLPPLLG